MAYTTYSYSQSADFPNSVVNTGRLSKEVTESVSITIKLDGISVTGDDVSITFVDSLSVNEQAALDTIVASHSGNSLPEANITRVSSEKPELAEQWFHSYNWCDPTTWFQRSIRVTGELLTPVGVSRLQWKANNSFIIDLVHGKYTEEDEISAPYLAKVYVDGQLQTENEPLAYSNGARDYHLDYRAGIVSFNEPVDPGAVVTMDYSWARDSTYSIVPLPGKKILMQDAEAEFTTDFDMRDTVIYQAFVYAQVAAFEAGIDIPTLQWVLTQQFGGSRNTLMSFLGLVDGYGEPLQRDLQPLDKVPVNVEKRTYKTYWDFKAQSNGNYPLIPSVGGQLRGTRSDSITHPFNYRGRKELDSAIGAEARMWLKNHIPFGTSESKATATFYCLIEDS